MEGIAMYEHHTQPLLPRRHFVRRVVYHIWITSLLFLGSLVLGVLGYHFTEGLSWLDALLNASMILGGMGPVDSLATAPGKIFASVYALYSGVIVLAGAGIIVAPIAHRIMHRLHSSDTKNDR
jgi:hypothetical protein